MVRVFHLRAPVLGGFLMFIAMSNTNFLFDDEYLFRIRLKRGWIYGLFRQRLAFRVSYRVLHGWCYRLRIHIFWLELGFSTL